jgi:hypothetical protein
MAFDYHSKLYRKLKQGGSWFYARPGKNICKTSFSTEKTQAWW